MANLRLIDFGQEVSVSLIESDDRCCFIVNKTMSEGNQTLLKRTLLTATIGFQTKMFVNPSSGIVKIATYVDDNNPELDCDIEMTASDGWRMVAANSGKKQIYALTKENVYDIIEHFKRIYCW